MTKYIVNTTWKHTQKIDPEEMREHLSVLKAENAHDDIYWFLIDEFTHGSTAIFSSKEEYDEWKDARQIVHREITNELGTTLIHENKGPVIVQMSELD